MNQPRNLRELLDAIAKDFGEAQGPSFNDKTAISDRVMLAQEIRTMLDAPHDFEPGDVVRLRFPTSNPKVPFVKDAGFALVIETFPVVKALELFRADPAAVKGMNISDATSRFDVVLGVFCDEGHFHTFIADSRYLEPHPDFARGAV